MTWPRRWSAPAGVSTYDQLAANQILIAALEEDGITVDQTVKALPAAEPAAMPAEQLANAGYYGTTSVQYKVDIAADGTMTLANMNYPTTMPAQTFSYYSDGSFRDEYGSYISFVKEDNGQTYLYQQAVSPLPGLGALPVASYAAVRAAGESPLPRGGPLPGKTSPPRAYPAP